MQGKRILITGGAGFVGSNLCRKLAPENQVISLDNYFTGSRETHVPGVEYREGHSKDVAKLVPEKVDLIYHLGEYARVEQSLEEPDLVWDLNILGTHGVVESWRARNAKGRCKLVYAGSSTKFGDGGQARNATPYAWTKASNTELVKNYATWYGLPYAITYFYNVYGPGERTGRYGTVIAIFKDRIARGEALQVRSPGTQKRNFTHVDDIIDGLVLVGEKGEGNEFGLGNPRAYSLLDVARLFGGEIEMLPERPGNRRGSDLDDSKSRQLGWTPRRELEAYIQEFLASRSNRGTS